MAKEDTKAGARGLAESTFMGLNLDPAQIEVQKGFNARDFSSPENKEHVQTLADSIKSVGVQTPLVVRFVAGQFILVDGESRLRAVKLAISQGAPIKTVPAIQEGKGISEEDRIASLISRNSGKQLTLLERGEVFARLQKFGWKDAEIAAKTGMTPANVSNIMTLHTAPEDVKALVKSGSVAPSLAIKAVRDHGDEASTALREAVTNAKGEGKDRATAQHVTAKKTTESKKRSPFSFSGTEAKTMFGALVDLYANNLPGNENRKARSICSTVFEDTLGTNWKVLIKQYADEYALS